MAWLLLLLSSLLLAAVALYLLRIFHEHRAAKFFDNATLKIAFVIAHPDDEVMFFAPTLLRMNCVMPSAKVYLLCLTNGNHRGLGRIREKELTESCKILRIPAGNVVCLNESSFQDGGDWDMSAVKTALERFVDGSRINMIVTFGSYGVSGHPDHQRVNAVVRQLNVDKMFLEDVTLLRKYAGLIDAVYTSLEHAVLKKKPTFMASVHDLIQAFRAMRCHQSQLVWFRVLYLIFSRYMIVNTFEYVKWKER